MKKILDRVIDHINGQLQFLSIRQNELIEEFLDKKQHTAEEVETLHNSTEYIMAKQSAYDEMLEYINSIY